MKSIRTCNFLKSLFLTMVKKFSWMDWNDWRSGVVALANNDVLFTAISSYVDLRKIPKSNLRWTNLKIVLLEWKFLTKQRLRVWLSYSYNRFQELKFQFIRLVEVESQLHLQLIKNFSIMFDSFSSSAQVCF